MSDLHTTDNSMAYLSTCDVPRISQVHLTIFGGCIHNTQFSTNSSVAQDRLSTEALPTQETPF